VRPRSLYQPVEDTADTLAANFKPVFKVVSRNTIWAIHDKELKKVKIENLYFDDEEIIGKKKTTYNSVALIGNAENVANCEASKPCLGHRGAGYVPHVRQHAGLGGGGDLG